MGAGPGRCKKCSSGYQQVGSKCLGESPANGIQALGGPCHLKLRGVRIWTEQGKEGWNVTWARAEGSCHDLSNTESGVLHVGCCPGSQGSDPSLPSLKMWTSVRQRCVQERTSSARTPRAVTVVSVLRATNRLRASV